MLNLRPVYHSTDKGVRGHVFVCILALLLRRLMEKKAEKLFEEIFEELERLKVNVIDHRGEEIFQRNEISPCQDEIFDLLEVEKPPKILVSPS
ncbi:hypothetical protein AKJ61_04210 [candidate division MSBL1 archaeon SCGC-AAA259B11]|nr:hypothetical protein AKJ61_04210 [candidate division MSBL1 archaeon SCGC-AAA259B11]